MINRTIVIHLLKLTFGISLIVAMLVLVDAEALWNHVKDLNLFLFVMALLSSNGLVIFQAIRQRCLLVGTSINALMVIKIQYIATFAGNFLPSIIGVDLYKVLSLRKHAGSILVSGKIVATDRLGGMITITGFGLLSLWVNPGILTKFLPHLFAQAQLIILISASFLMVLFLVVLFKMFFTEWPRLWAVILWRFICINFVVYGLQIIKFFFLGKMVGIYISPIVLAQMLLVHQFAALLPITLGGLGVVEGSIVAMLIIFNVPSAAGTAIALGNRLTIALVSLVGYVLWLRLKKLNEL